MGGEEQGGPNTEVGKVAESGRLAMRVDQLEEILDYRGEPRVLCEGELGGAALSGIKISMSRDRHGGYVLLTQLRLAEDRQAPVFNDGYISPDVRKWVVGELKRLAAAENIREKQGRGERDSWKGDRDEIFVMDSSYDPYDNWRDNRESREWDGVSQRVNVQIKGYDAIRIEFGMRSKADDLRRKTNIAEAAARKRGEDHADVDENAVQATGVVEVEFGMPVKWMKDDPARLFQEYGKWMLAVMEGLEEAMGGQMPAGEIRLALDGGGVRQMEVKPESGGEPLTPAGPEVLSKLMSGVGDKLSVRGERDRMMSLHGWLIGGDGEDAYREMERMVNGETFRKLVENSWGRVEQRMERGEEPDEVDEQEGQMRLRHRETEDGLRPGGEMGRIYLTPKMGVMPRVLEGVAGRLVGAGVDFDCKVMVDPGEVYKRDDRMVVYFAEGDEEAVLAAVEEVYAEHGEDFLAGKPRMAVALNDNEGRVMWGVSFMQEPEMSMGMRREGPESVGSLSASEIRRLALNYMHEERLYGEEGLRQALEFYGIDPDNPAFNLGGERFALIRERVAGY